MQDFENQQTHFREKNSKLGVPSEMLGFCENVGGKNGILLPKLFWPTVRKKCSSDLEKLLKFEAEGQEFANFVISLEQFIQTVQGPVRAIFVFMLVFKLMYGELIY